MSKILLELKCLMCGHTWRSVMEAGYKPSVCPRCKSYNWDRGRRRKFVERVWKGVGAVVEGSGQG